MSNYHIYECDSCGKKEMTGELPKYWATVEVFDSNKPEQYQHKHADVCMACVRDVYRAIERKPDVPKPIKREEAA